MLRVRRSPRLVWLLMAVFVAGLAVACGGDDDAGSPASPTRELPGTLLATASGVKTPTPPPTRTPTPTGTLTATPTRTPTPTDRPPLIGWLIREHAGPGVVTVRIETNVPTTAIVRVVGKPGEPPGVDPQESTGRSLAHTVSIPFPENTFIQVEVKADNGSITIGELEGGNTVVGNQYWGRGDGRPRAVLATGFRGVVTWANLTEPNAPRGAATVQLFSRPVGCTTAQACRYSRGQAFRADDVKVEESAERHSIPVQFQERNVDYLVLVEAAPISTGSGRSLQRFFQFEVKDADFPR